MKSRPRTERPPRPPASPVDAERVLGVEGATVVDILDRLLSKGVVATGDITLGVAGVDLVYLRLSALLSAVDKVLSRQSPPSRVGRRRRAGVKRRPADERRRGRL
jgi:hypothetical protein